MRTMSALRLASALPLFATGLGAIGLLGCAGRKRLLHAPPDIVSSDIEQQSPRYWARESVPPNNR